MIAKYTIQLLTGLGVGMGVMFTLDKMTFERVQKALLPYHELEFSKANDDLYMVTHNNNFSTKKKQQVFLKVLKARGQSPRLT